MSAEYPIDTLAQMAAIPAEARARFLSELPSILETATAMNTMGALLPDGMEVVSGKGAVWIDDDLGTTTVTLGVEGRDGAFEEISKTTFKMAR